MTTWTRAGWALAALLAAILWWRSAFQHAGYPALVAAGRRELGTLEGARLADVYVRAGERVTAGQPLARIDCARLDGEATVARALLDEQVAELAAAPVELAREARHERMEVARARAELASAKGAQEGNRAELATLNGQLAQLDGAIKSRIVQADRLTELRSRQQRLGREAVHDPDTVHAWAEIGAQMADAAKQIDAEAEARLRTVRARLETQSERVQHLEAQLAQCDLRAPADGRISQVLHQPGDSVPAGSPVVVFVSEEPRVVTAYVPEGEPNPFAPGQSVVVAARDGHADGIAGRVDDVGPEVLEMPSRLWLRPGEPRYGRPVHVALAGEMGLLPGEAALVRAGSDGDSAEAGTAVPDGLTRAVVPAELAKRSRLEVSGALWLPERKRFLLVSDETGTSDADEHRPWVFTATEDGRLDPEPVVMKGLEEISDLESLTRAPDGTIYLLASLSRSKKGTRPTARELLVRAKLTERGLDVTGTVPFVTAVLAKLSPEQRIELGASDATLNVEGMTWSPDGLLFGLKAPQDGHGAARLWLVRDVDALFDGPSGEPRISLYGTLALPTCGAEAHGGISDLSLEKDELYLLSTIPKGPACGSAWRVRLPLAGKAPAKLADWKSAKPEGIGRAGDGSLVVWFDTDGATPLLTKLIEAKP